MKLLPTRPLRNRYLFASDLSLLAIAAYVSCVLRLERFDLGAYWPGILLFAGLALVVTPLVFACAGVYSCYWRYASVEELLLLTGSLTAAVVLIAALSFAITCWSPSAPPLPRSIPFIFLLLALVATAGPRLLAPVSPLDRHKAILRQRNMRSRNRSSSWARATPAPSSSASCATTPTLACNRSASWMMIWASTM